MTIPSMLPNNVLKRIGPMAQGVTAGLVIALLATMVVPTAQAQDLSNVVDRLARMERDIRLLNRQISLGHAPAADDAAGGNVTAASAEPMPATAMARVSVRLTTLEEDVRALTGTAESLSHGMAQLNERLGKLVGDMEFRLSALERAAGVGGMASTTAQPGGTPQAPAAPAGGLTSGGSAASPVVQATPMGSSGMLGTVGQKDLDVVRAQPAAQMADQETAPVSAPTPVEKPATVAATAPATDPAPTAETSASSAATPAPAIAASPQDQYAQAFGMLRKADYIGAQTALESFLAAHGDHALAANAHYWLGETHYVRGNYPQAAEVFLDAYQRSPKATKAPDILLKLGMSLANLQKPAEACAAFAKLTADYPRASTSISRKVRAEQKRHNCQ